MICAIMQPTFLPWVGYFSMMCRVDRFVYLDDVQLTRRSWQVRNRILSNGGVVTITVPVRKTSRDVKICDAELALDGRWISATLKKIEMSYARSSFISEVIDILSEELESKHVKLSDLNIGIIERFAKYLRFDVDTVRSSSLNVPGKRSKKLLNICKILGSDAYLAAEGSRQYIEEDGLFLTDPIRLSYYEYKPEPYYQIKTDQFVPYMSIVDLVANVGPKVAFEYIRSK